MDRLAGSGAASLLRRLAMHRRLLTGLVAAVAVGSFSLIVFYAYDQGSRPGGESVAPIIRADQSPVKMRPDRPGGLEVPNRDKTVFERIAPAPGGPGERTTETLLPPPEVPMLPPAVTPAAGPSRPTVSDILNPPAPETPPKTTRLPEIAAAPPTILTAPPATRPAKGWQVQIAALRSEEAALAAWQRLKTAYPADLGTLSSNLRRVDLGAGKGVFYRLQAGPLDSEAAARQLCATLKERKQGCLVVGP